MSTMNVSIRDLKARLSEYLRHAAGGQEVVVTLHNRPIAKLVPMSRAPESEQEALQRLTAMPWVRPASGSAPLGSRNPARPPHGGRRVSDLLSATGSRKSR
jgi:prevent-host-death family protein